MMSAHEVLKEDKTLSKQLIISEEQILEQKLKRQEQDKSIKSKSDLLQKIRNLQNQKAKEEKVTQKNEESEGEVESDNDKLEQEEELKKTKE